MTAVDVSYRYGNAPGEPELRALNAFREVYGVRKLLLDEAARTIRVEYDATRLNEEMIHRLLLQAGVDVAEQLTLA